MESDEENGDVESDVGYFAILDVYMCLNIFSYLDLSSLGICAQEAFQRKQQTLHATSVR